MLLLSRMRDLRRVFEYHGAEHKTISCFEAGLPLTPANAQRFSRLHPRCGTSFLLVVMIVAIFVFAPIGLPAWYWLVATRILGVPLIAGISFELIKFAGRNRRRALGAGGDVAGAEAAAADHARARPRPARGRDRRAGGGARARDARRSWRPPTWWAWRSWRRPRSVRRLPVRSRPPRLALHDRRPRQSRSRRASPSSAQQMTDPEVIADRERYAEVGRAYRQLEPAAKLAARMAARAATTPPARRSCSPRMARTPSCASCWRARASGSRSSRRRSAWRWSSATPTTTRT